MSNKTILTKETECWNCKKVSDALRQMPGDDRLPEKGDATICFYCGEIAILTEDLVPIEPTTDEYLDIRLQGGKEIDEVQALIKKYWKLKRDLEKKDG